MVICIPSSVTSHVHVNRKGTEAVGLLADFIFRIPCGGVDGCSDVLDSSCISGFACLEFALGEARKEGMETVRGGSLPLDAMFGVEI